MLIPVLSTKLYCTTPVKTRRTSHLSTGYDLSRVDSCPGISRLLGGWLFRSQHCLVNHYVETFPLYNICLSSTCRLKPLAFPVKSGPQRCCLIRLCFMRLNCMRTLAISS